MPPLTPGMCYRRVTFTDGPLGLVLSPVGPRGDEALVVDIVDGGQADRSGVKVEDICVGVSPQGPDTAFIPIRSHEDATRYLPHAGRPVVITFMGTDPSAPQSTPPSAVIADAAPATREDWVCTAWWVKDAPGVLLTLHAFVSFR